MFSKITHSEKENILLKKTETNIQATIIKSVLYTSVKVNKSILQFNLHSGNISLSTQHILSDLSWALRQTECGVQSLVFYLLTVQVNFSKSPVLFTFFNIRLVMATSWCYEN